jgi:hypothetical protein
VWYIYQQRSFYQAPSSHESKRQILANQQIGYNGVFNSNEIGYLPSLDKKKQEQRGRTRVIVALETDSPKLNVFCAMSQTKLCGQFFFYEKTATGTS